MSKYTSRSSKPMEPSRINREIHPIWRGVGFVIMIITPLLGFAAMTVFMDANFEQGWVQFPKELLVNGPDQYLLVKILLTILFMLVFYGILTFFSFLIFRIVAPPQYGPYDVPPVTYTGKQYKR